jgi:hypothetical protein
LRKFSATGLIAGTLMPDVEYFINMGADCDNFHTWQSVFLSYLPLSVLVSLVFHLLIRDSLINNLPSFLQRQYGSFKDFNFLRYLRHHWFVFLYSVIAGIASHFLWDAFSHGTSIFAFMSDLYRQKVYILDKDFSMFMVSQYLHSLFGMVIFARFIFRFSAGKKAPVSRVKTSYWITIGLVLMVIMMIRIYAFEEAATISDILISFVSASFMALLFRGKVEKVKTFLSDLYLRPRIEFLPTGQAAASQAQWIARTLQKDSSATIEVRQ